MKSFERIVKIKDCPSFVDFRPGADVPNFAKLNLIYGWNGAGKTTFSRILRTFETGENLFASPTAPGRFEFRMSDDDNLTEENVGDFKSIRVFNKDFIEDTIFRQDGPKPIYFLGKESKEAKENIEKAAEEILVYEKKLASTRNQLEKLDKSRERQMSGEARKIKEALTTTGSTDKFRNYDKAQLSKTIGENKIRLESGESLKLDAAKFVILSKGILESPLPSLSAPVTPDFNLSELESQVLDLIQRNISSTTIDKLKSDEELGKWVEHGLYIHKSRSLSKCEFCEQPISQQRLEELDKHFSDEYQKTILQIADLKGKCEQRKIRVSGIDSSEFYEEFVPIFAAEKMQSGKTIDAHNKRLDQFIDALISKEKNVFSAPSLPAAESLDSKSFFKINDIIEKNNEKTRNFVERIKADKETLELHHVAEFYPILIGLQQEIDENKKEEDSSKEKIHVLQGAIDAAKETLRSHHGSAREITTNLREFLGRSDIHIVSIEREGAKGYEIMRGESIAKNLSEGERTALAIAYFISKIREDGFDIKNSVIVIDDPVSSLDSSAIYQSFSFLKAATKEAGQVFILTHHFDFFRLVKRWLKREKGEFYMISCRGDEGVRKSQLTKMDKLLLDYESEYHFLFSILYRFSKEEDVALEKIYSIPNVARKFLESFLAFRVPILRKPEPNLHHRLLEISFHEEKRTRIERFVETHSHPRYESGVQDFDLTLLGEASAIIQDLLELVQVEDPKHYAFLVKSLAAT